MRSFEENLRILANEAVANKSIVVAIFLAVIALSVIVGAVWPKEYSSSGTIIIDERNIIQPLMQGAAVPTEVVDMGRVASEVVFSRKVLTQALQDAGWMTGSASPADREQLMAYLKKQTKVENTGGNVVRIAYHDTDPDRAYKTARGLFEAFLEESRGVKVNESATAFKFIDDQVKAYQTKLVETEEKLKQFRDAGIDVRALRGQGDTSIESIEARLDRERRELQEAQVKQASLEKQLTQELQSASVYTREREYRDRLNAAQTELARLRLSYKDNYPDIGRLKAEIEDVKALLAAEQKAHPGGLAAMNQESTSAFHQELKQQLAQTRTQIDLLTARVSESERLLEAERESARRFGGATLSELLRNYEVTQTSLQDLLRRREAARVSMNLDKEKSGLALRVLDEPARPVRPSGLTFAQFLGGGLVIALFAPFGLLYARNQFDGRVRSESVITEKLNLPLAAKVPHLATPSEAVSAKRELQWSAIIIATAILMVIGIIWTGSKL